MFILVLILSSSLFAQELELNTSNIHAYAQVKNCLDLTMCSPYQESLQKTKEVYRWRVKFNEPIDHVTKAMSECRISYSDFTLLIRGEDGKVLSDFKLLYGKKNERLRQKYFPMELREEALVSLKSKEPTMEALLKKSESLSAMKSAAFEFEYSLQEYDLKVAPLPPKVLGRTHHLLKDITYDLSKWDGKICRFYQVMRHEVQHIKNVREIMDCGGNHHFARGKNDDISVYVNDLSFIDRYCPEDKELYKNVESVLFAMYEGRPVETGCSEGAPHQDDPRIAKKSPKTSASAHAAASKFKQKGFLKFHQNSWKKRASGNEPLPQKNPALR